MFLLLQRCFYCMGCFTTNSKSWLKLFILKFWYRWIHLESVTAVCVCSAVLWPLLLWTVSHQISSLDCCLLCAVGWSLFSMIWRNCGHYSKFRFASARKKHKNWDPSFRGYYCCHGFLKWLNLYTVSTKSKPNVFFWLTLKVNKFPSNLALSISD